MSTFQTLFDIADRLYEESGRLDPLLRVKAVELRDTVQEIRNVAGQVMRVTDQPPPGSAILVTTDMGKATAVRVGVDYWTVLDYQDHYSAGWTWSQILDLAVRGYTEIGRPRDYL